MAFSNTFTPIWLAPGATSYWGYTWNDNHGMQSACADAKTPGSNLVAFDQSLTRDSNGAITYYVSIRNNGPQWAYFNLQGGGVV
jgi:hypothetical protein